MSPQLGFSFNISRCSGCMACVVACQDENDLPGDGLSFRLVTRLENGQHPLEKGQHLLEKGQHPLEKGQHPSASLAFLSLTCLHCGDAPCMMVCPTGAIYKRDWDGIVGVNRDLCVGCHSCALACPFGAPRYFDDGKMSKCHFCVSRVEHGLEPACVRVCPTRAIGFGALDDLSRQKVEKASLSILEPLLKISES